jgi:activator of HSP90 ATPase
MSRKVKVDLQQGEAVSRRKFSILLGSFASAFALSARAFAASDNRLTPISAGEEISHSCETIHQTVAFKASRKRVYEALTDEKQFDKVVKLSAAVQSGEPLGNKPTQIAREAGGPFTLFGGHIVGRHVELVPGERIVQAWRVATWEPGVYSIVRFQLVEEGAGTKLTFDHTGFPNGQGEHLAAGWKGNYWEPLAKVLA